MAPGLVSVQPLRQSLRRGKQSVSWGFARSQSALGAGWLFPVCAVPSFTFLKDGCGCWRLKGDKVRIPIVQEVPQCSQGMGSWGLFLYSAVQCYPRHIIPLRHFPERIREVSLLVKKKFLKCFNPKYLYYRDANFSFFDITAVRLLLCIFNLQYFEKNTEGLFDVCLSSFYNGLW